jgi:cytidine deaminase
VDTTTEQKLIAEATAARENASALYSHFKVGAALTTTDCAIFRGCNVENASYGLTVCAERVALLSAIAAGQRSFKEIAVVTDAPEPATPCGPCRQLLWEYAGDIDVVLANLHGTTRRFALSELLPHPFSLLPEIAR